MKRPPLIVVPNHLRPLATAEQAIGAQLEAWQAEEKFEARRAQAARRLGVGDSEAFGDAPGGHPRSDVGGSLAPTTPTPRWHSSGAVRAAVSSPAELAVIVALCVLIVIPFLWLGWLLGQQ